eukprot:m.35577 g.35577  ORF g.35577 m.35577 type:complete len:203 (+) comp17163_c0_seq1:96-704(+)
MYVTIANQNDRELVVTREPSTRGYVIFWCWMIAAVYLLFSWPDHTLAGRAITACFFAWIGYTFLEEHQTCTIAKDRIVFKRWSILNRVFKSRIPEKIYTCPVSSVSVIMEKIKYVGQGHQVLLDLEDGHEVPITMSCTTGPKEEHMAAANTIAEFLKVHVLQQNGRDDYADLKARTIAEVGRASDTEDATNDVDGEEEKKDR